MITVAIALCPIRKRRHHCIFGGNEILGGAIGGKMLSEGELEEAEAAKGLQRSSGLKKRRSVHA
jgi:hypothetical protein